MRLSKRTTSEPTQPKTKERDPVLDPYRDLGFEVRTLTRKDATGDCPLCGAEGDKFSVHRKSGVFRCWVCDQTGNQIVYFGLYLQEMRDRFPMQKAKRIKRLSEHREIPEDILLDAGICFDGERYLMPVKNQQGNVINIRKFHLSAKIKMFNLPGINSSIWNLDRINDNVKEIIVCEGEWDAMAARAMLSETQDKDLRRKFRKGEVEVIGLPGAGVWKRDWNRFTENKHVTLVFDKDDAGRKGLKKTWNLLGGKDRGNMCYIDWPEEMEEGVDLRDFYRVDGTMTLLQELEATTPNWQEDAAPPDTDEKPRYTGSRPTFKKVLTTYQKWLHMTPEHVNILKITYATILSNRFKGDPLWLFVVGPPGSGKTEILMSTSQVFDVVKASNLSSTSLLSGWCGPGGSDPSLLPRLLEKTFVLKDFTEVLDMPKSERDQVYSVLRGAHDGEVMRSYGNGVVRDYKGTFSMLAGVTYSIDRDSDTSMGERFLKYRMKPLGEDVRRLIMMDTLRNSGNEDTMRTELHEISKRFLDPDVPGMKDLQVPMDYLERIVSLAEICGPLRTSVERDTIQRDRIKYKPHTELGTRISRELKKLLLGLACLHDDPQITEKDFQICIKVALNSCHPFYLEVVRELIETPGQNVDALTKKVGLPMTTLRETMESMAMVGIITREKDPSLRRGMSIGPKAYLWSVSEPVKKQWKRAGIQ